jgi:hypothetical protein
MLAAAPEIRAQDINVPMDVQVPIIRKVFEFDRELVGRSGEAIRIAVLYQVGNRESLKAAEDVEDAIRSMGPAIVEGLPIEFELLAWSSARELESELDHREIDVLYVMPFRAVSIAVIARIARARGIRTASAVPSYVDDHLCVAVDLVGGRPQIVINRQASTAEGSAFSAQLLKLARLTND